MRSIKSIHRVVLAALFALCLLPASSHAQTNPLTGEYYGTATITSPSSLGTIDLAFYLTVGAGGAVNSATSYIIVDKTLLFPVVPPTVNGIYAGPRVSGTLTSTSFSLTSSDFTSESNAFGKTVTRRITLTGTKVSANGTSISGNFTEVISNLAENPITLTGTFMLMKPVIMTTPGLTELNGDGCIDLDEVRQGGKNASKMEFFDMSHAFHLYYTPAVQPNLCEPKSTLLQNALQEYFSTEQ